MLVNPNYNAGGGSPTPSSGYVEDDMLYYYDNSGNKIESRTREIDIDNTGYAASLTLNNVFTLEAYVRVDGASSAGTWFRAFELGKDTNVPPVAIGLGSQGGTTDSDICFNVLYYFSGSTSGGYADDVIYQEGLMYGDMHTYSIKCDGSQITSYIDGVEVGNPINVSPLSAKIEGVTIEGRATQRPLNGSLLNGRFYTRALTAAELAANHANDVAKYGGND
jgi:hypothetical protein